MPYWTCCKNGFKILKDFFLGFEVKIRWISLFSKELHTTDLLAPQHSYLRLSVYPKPRRTLGSRISRLIMYWMNGSVIFQNWKKIQRNVSTPTPLPPHPVSFWHRGRKYRTVTRGPVWPRNRALPPTTGDRGRFSAQNRKKVLEQSSHHGLQHRTPALWAPLPTAPYSPPARLWTQVGPWPQRLSQAYNSKLSRGRSRPAALGAAMLGAGRVTQALQWPRETEPQQLHVQLGKLGRRGTRKEGRSLESVVEPNLATLLCLHFVTLLSRLNRGTLASQWAWARRTEPSSESIVKPKCKPKRGVAIVGGGAVEQPD